jgi:hypothetical protein
MEQHRHRLTNVSPKGQTCRADQNPLKHRGLVTDGLICHLLTNDTQLFSWQNQDTPDLIRMHPCTAKESPKCGGNPEVMPKN